MQFCGFFPTLAFIFDIDHRKKLHPLIFLKHQFNKRSMYFNFLSILILLYQTKLHVHNNSYVVHMYLPAPAVCKANVTKKFKIFDLKFVNPTPPPFHEQKKMQFKYKK